MENMNKDIDTTGLLKRNTIPEARLKLVKTRKGIDFYEPLDLTYKYYRFVHEIVKDLSREIMIMISLDCDLRPVNYAIISVGGLDRVYIDTNIIYKFFYLSGGSQFVLVHNHPHGDSKPSEADLKLTLKIVKQCRLLDIDFIDHIVIGSSDRYEDYRSIETWYPEIWTHRKIIHEYSQRDGHQVR